MPKTLFSSYLNSTLTLYLSLCRLATKLRENSFVARDLAAGIDTTPIAGDGYGKKLGMKLVFVSKWKSQFTVSRYVKIRYNFILDMLLLA